MVPPFEKRERNHDIDRNDEAKKKSSKRRFANIGAKPILGSRTEAAKGSSDWPLILDGRFSVSTSAGAARQLWRSKSFENDLARACDGMGKRRLLQRPPNFRYAVVMSRQGVRSSPPMTAMRAQLNASTRT